MSQLDSYISKVNPDLEGARCIAIYSDGIRECINNMAKARQSSYWKVARQVIDEKDKKRIEERQNGDWSIEYLNKTRAEDFGIGEGR